jgi:hypothetical protein
MRAPIGLMTLICVGALSQALALEPPTSSTPPATPDSAPASQADRTPADPQPGVKTPGDAPASDSPAAPTTTMKATVTSDGSRVKLTTTDPETAAEIKRLTAAGYSPQMRGTEVVFCRKEIPVGSRFEKKTCNTADELANIARGAQENAQKVQRNNSGTPRGSG